jgi:hypothetical protein
MVTIPTEIQAGLSVSFRVSLSDFPASSWAATLYLRSATGKADVAATADGDEFVFTMPASETATWSAGLYSAVLRVSSGEDVHQPYSGRLTVLPDVAAADSFDPRTAAEKMLEAIQATLASRATTDQLKIEFNRRSLEKTPLTDLLKLEARFIRKVNAERRKKAGRSPIKVTKVRLP